MADDPAADRSARLAALLARVALADQRGVRRALPADVVASVRGRAAYREGPAAAEEILQEAYVNVWHHAGTYDAAKSQPLTWLTSIVRNRCLDQLRRREIDTVTHDAATTTTPGVRPAVGRSDAGRDAAPGAEAQSVRDCVERSTPARSRRSRWRSSRACRTRELAAHLREPLGTVKSWVRRGLERLKRCLDGAGYAR